MRTARLQRLRSAQGGVMLLEALLGLLIFSLGVLALVAMQAVSISNVSNAKYRVDAAFMAEEIMNYMWLADPTPTAMASAFVYPGGNSPYLMNWVTRIQNPATGLPGAGTYPPIIVIGGATCLPPPGGCVTPVTVTIRWKAPDAIAPSNHIAIAYIAQ
jgi:type IV pilus assembly protein PilV